jgi:hypothetical protein
MGVYADNISKLSMKEILENLKNIEEAIKNTKKRIERTKRRIKINHFDARDGSDILESLYHSLVIWENKLVVNSGRFNQLCDDVAEEIEQLMSEGKWDFDEEQKN